MTAIPNSHAALLKNQAQLQGRVALIGVTAAAVLPRLSPGGLVFTDHFGCFREIEQLAQQPAASQWTPVFGYLEPAAALGTLDTVAVFMPKAKAELALRLALAASLLAAGGKVLVIGEKKEGIASASRVLATIAPTPLKVDSARHCQVWAGYPAQTGRALEVSDWLSWHTVSVAGLDIRVAGLPGIFSDGRLDEGTGHLLDTLASHPVKGPVLDFACGAGVVGAWLESRARQTSEHGLVVDGIDVQAQAVTCARKSYQQAQAQGTIIAGDGLAELQGCYRTIVTNPPFHAGVRTDTSMTTRFLQQAKRHLLPGGELRLVANTFLPYQNAIATHIGPVDVLFQDKRFTVYRARR
ncbi:methyltransferase [Marinobacter sp. X15-166B]|uniref:methyltransferase n=1 Tax=Marinobacter sp. X15-166B TaxID=1897620 RepID=UPI00085C6922|nr:methyltransferase [Marinobacter sp. X15-166B]OEY67107.1 SAM-dependent methyltransferase [Marinobacter sp. X15-166B]